MRYVERPAPAGLEESVARIWFLEAPRLRRFEKILPLPYAHLIVNLSEPYAIYDRAGTATPVEDAFLSGIQSEYLVIESPPLIRHVGIELRPAGVHAVSGVAATELAGRVSDARAVVPGVGAFVSALQRELRNGVAADGALDLATDFLTDLCATTSPDGVVVAALNAIHRDPSAPIGEIARHAGTSERTLSTRFRTATGVTPKAYAQLWRFHRFVNELAETPGRPDWAGLAAESGYYDQPHVIRAFRRFSGWTPTVYRERVAEFGPDAAHFVPLDDVPITRANKPPAATR